MNLLQALGFARVSRLALNAAEESAVMLSMHERACRSPVPELEDPNVQLGLDRGQAGRGRLEPHSYRHMIAITFTVQNST